MVCKCAKAVKTNQTGIIELSHCQIVELDTLLTILLYIPLCRGVAELGGHVEVAAAAVFYVGLVVEHAAVYV